MAAWARAMAAGSADELRERIDEAAARCWHDVGNAYHLASLFRMRSVAWRRGRDAEAAMYLDGRSRWCAASISRPTGCACSATSGSPRSCASDTAAADDAFREALGQPRTGPLGPRGALTGLAAVAADRGGRTRRTAGRRSRRAPQRSDR